MNKSSPYKEFLNRLEAIKKDGLRSEQFEKTLRLIDWFAHTVLNSLSAHVAILDENGIIIQTNQAWRDFALANHMKIRPSTVGMNYLDLCDSARGKSASGSREVAKGIREVIAGRIKEVVVEYPLRVAKENKWFYMRATRLSAPAPIRVVVSHENITALKQAEESLRKREAELEMKTLNLQEANTALKVLLKRREEDKIELEERIVSNVKDIAGVYVPKLRRTSLDDRQRQYLDIIESGLNDITSSFSRRLSSRNLAFTPNEIHVAKLIRDGRTTKEIADIMDRSISAVEFHRKNIRRKLNLLNQKANLQSHLQTYT